MLFYRVLFGVVEIAHVNGTSYLSGGRKPAYDIAIVPGRPGLHHLAFEVADGDDLQRAHTRLQAAGVAVRQLDDGQDHGIAAGIGFVLPSGHAFELVALADPAVFDGTPRVAAKHFAGAGPIELEHASIECNNVGETAEFLQAQLDFRTTEYSRPAGGPWFLAFLRSTELHHDLGLFRHDRWDGPGFNHVGFAVPSILEIARVADIASAHGWRLQHSPGRHLVGDNIFAYLLDPSGNRVEVGTPMIRVAPLRADPSIRRERRQ